MLDVVGLCDDDVGVFIECDVVDVLLMLKFVSVFKLCVFFV